MQGKADPRKQGHVMQGKNGNNLFQIKAFLAILHVSLFLDFEPLEAESLQHA
jgi:hypothetical protein